MRIGVLASVGHMIDSFFPEIVAAWTASGHRVSIAAGTGTRDGSAVVVEGLTRRPGLGAVRAWTGLREWADRQRLDVIVTNTATASALVRSARLRTPVVYFCHGLHWNRGTAPADRVWQAAEHLLLRSTAGVITINSDDHAWFARRLPAGRILRLPAGVGLSPSAYPTGPVPGAGTLELAWIGEFSPRKRPRLALELADQLRDAGVDFRLRMLGEGALRGGINASIRRLGLQAQVSAAGSGDSAAVLLGSHALLHTAAWEGLPRVMLEALAVGRRAYAFDVKGVRDIPEAVLAPEGETGALAGQLTADWASGALLAPLATDRDALDVAHAAEAIRTFLEDAVLAPAGGGTS